MYCNVIPDAAYPICMFPPSYPIAPVELGGVYVAVSTSTAVLLLVSVAVTVITFWPPANDIGGIDHVVVPEAVPLDGVHDGHDQVTVETATLSEDVPDRVIGLTLPLSYVAAAVGDVTATVGSVVSVANASIE